MRDDLHPPLPALTSLLAREWTRPVPEAARIIATEIQQRHGEAVDAVLFYGSCLRTQQMADAVLDFYVLVRSYRSFYQRPLYGARTSSPRLCAAKMAALRILNALLPPNVFYIEVGQGAQTLRAKYAVISTADFECATTPAVVPAIIWARFCQPALLVFARSEVVQDRVIHAARQATLTFLSRVLPFFARNNLTRSFHPADLWQRGFRETYRTEFRTERPETIRAVYEASPERYDQVARLGLQLLEQQGRCACREKDGQWLVSMPRLTRWTGRLSWAVRATGAKCLYAVRLFKTALTFDDWLPYVLWKLGRHTGVWVELSERQRRYPLLLGWPVLFKLLRQRALR